MFVSLALMLMGLCLCLCASENSIRQISGSSYVSASVCLRLCHGCSHLLCFCYAYALVRASLKAFLQLLMDLLILMRDILFTVSLLDWQIVEFSFFYVLNIGTIIDLILCSLLDWMIGSLISWFIVWCVGIIFYCFTLFLIH